MKTIKNILLFILPLLALLSCSEQMERDMPADNKLSTTISVVLPQIPDAQPQTRAMGEEATLRTLHLAVFDQNGILLEYVKATELSKSSSNNTYTYKVILKPTQGVTTTIHFIGNGPENLNYATEMQAIASLSTGNNDDAYWQRITVDGGITSKTAIPLVHLIRNFAWIQLTESATNFEIDSYCVVNTYNKGSVAPYNSNSGWIDGYNTMSYSTLIGTGVGYNGFIPSEATLNTNIPDVNSWLNTGCFIYEREKALSNPPFILVKGKYTVNETTENNRYYKVDLRQEDGSYFPIIRNFQYKVNLTAVGHKGYDSPSEAAKSGGSGDVSTSVDTQPFTNISDDAVRLFVSYTDTTLVYNQEEGLAKTEFTLRYKFISFSGTQSLNGTEVTINPEGTSIQNGIITSLVRNGNDDTDGWREIKMETISVPQNTKVDGKQEITITGTVVIDGKIHTLQRKVILRLRPKYTMLLACNPGAIAKIQGKPFDLIIKVPGGLGSSMFPLNFQIEAEAQSITPDRGDDLPTITGKSIINKEKITIGFIKQLDYSVYEMISDDDKDGYIEVPCSLKSTKIESETDIHVQNQYFYTAQTHLGNYIQRYFDDMEFDPLLLPSEAGTPVGFSFSMDQEQIPETVIVTLSDNLEPAGDNNPLKSRGDGSYEFKPGQNATATLNLETVASSSSIAEVKLSAEYYEDASASLVSKIEIPAGNIKLTHSNLSTSSRDYGIYIKNPREYTNNNDPIATFKAKWGESNPNPIEIKLEQYQQIQDGWIYIKHTRTYSTYYARIKLEELLKDGGAAPEFNF